MIIEHITTASIFLPCFNTNKVNIKPPNILAPHLNQIIFRGNLDTDTFEASPFSKDKIHPALRKIISADENKIELYNFLRKNIDSTKRTTPEERYLKPASLETYDDDTMVKIVSLRAAGFDNIFELAEDEELFNKIMTLISKNEDNETVLEINGSKTVLKRPLTPKEADAMVKSKAGLKLLYEDAEGLLGFIDLANSGLNVLSSIAIASNKNVFCKYKTLTTPLNKENQAAFQNPDGEIVHLSSTLFPDEAAAILLSNRPQIQTGERIQGFINLKDITGFSNEDIIYYVERPSILKRLLELCGFYSKDDTKQLELTDSKGNKTLLQRPLSPNEAVFAIKMKNEKIKCFIELIEDGLALEDAAKFATSFHRYDRYKELTTRNKDGKVILTKGNIETILPRALRPDEAASVMRKKYIFTNERIKEDLETFGEIVIE